MKLVTRVVVKLWNEASVAAIILTICTQAFIIYQFYRKRTYQPVKYGERFTKTHPDINIRECITNKLTPRLLNERVYSPDV